MSRKIWVAQEQVIYSDLNGAFTFGGTGADGALSISSGTTTIDLGGAKFVVKNYSSISITGTGKLAFSNPASGGTVVILKSQGDVTLTSSTAPMIDASTLGAQGGTAGGTGASSGSTGGSGSSFFLFQTNGGSPGTTSAFGNGGTTPTAIAPSSPFSSGALAFFRYAMQLFVGGGGGGGGSGNASNNATQGAGGRGGGGLIIECGGGWNFTVTNGISVAGANGSPPTNTTYGGSGGGGAGGFCLVIYNTLIANTGTIDVSGGSGGTNGTNANAYAGGGGATPYSAGSNGVAGSGSGGDGADGVSLVCPNTEF